MANPSSAAQPKHRLTWCCIYCQRNYRTTTRVGKHSTCPHCGAQNPGPATVLGMMKELGRRMRGVPRNSADLDVTEEPEPEPEPEPTPPPPPEPASDAPAPSPPSAARPGGLRALLTGDWQQP